MVLHVRKSSIVSGRFTEQHHSLGDKGHIEIRPLTTDELPPETLEAFLAIGFTNHYEILAQKKDVEQRLFYIVNCATEFWNGDKLKYYVKDDLFGKRGNMPNNFAKTIANVDLRSKALRSFKDEYLLDFVNIEDSDETDERVIQRNSAISSKVTKNASCKYTMRFLIIFAEVALTRCPEPSCGKRWLRRSCSYTMP